MVMNKNNIKSFKNLGISDQRSRSFVLMVYVILEVLQRLFFQQKYQLSK